MHRSTEKKVEWVKNRWYSAEYNEDELSFFTTKEIKGVLKFQKTHPSYTQTPLVSLQNLASHLNLKDIKVKDESHRFGLNAFKVLGGIYAIGKYLANKLGKEIEHLSFSELQSPEVKKKLGEITFISATDGNHGRGVAWAARELGQKSVIYMPKGSSRERLEAIRKEGAQADITDVNYDETVRMCAKLAEENGWVLVQDTAWDGYEEIPLWIMQGYAAMAHEIVEDLESSNEPPPTHIFLQAGVGSFAGSITAYFRQYYREHSPNIIVVEPNQADCYYRSFCSAEGNREIVSDDMNTIMAGLACGEPNTRAFRILKQYSLAAFSCEDSIAALGMRILGNPLGDDAKIISGESGAVSLGLLYYLRRFGLGKASQDIMLDSDSRVLVISTEGDTDKQHYLDVVWRGFYPIL